MSSSRILRAVAVGVFTATIVLSSPAHAAMREGDPRDPIVRLIKKYVKKIFTIITQDDLKPDPPHP
jgi:hypothetical protein